jgi:hypothetical protein
LNGAAVRFNKFEHLESLSETTQILLNSDSLGELALPKLRHLEMCIVGEEGKCFDSYLQRRIPTRFSRTTLDKLAENCPKLLRFFGVDTEETDSIMYAQRLNAAAKFRRVRPIRGEVNGIELKFDYDSVESCTSDEDC